MLKKCKVVMIPTNQKAGIDHDGTIPHSLKGNLILPSTASGSKRLVQSGYTSHHLYIINKDVEIQNGDYFYDNQEVFLCNGFIDGRLCGINSEGSVLQGDNDPDYFKIIASTDPSLDIPSPSKAFIAKYCEVGGIDEVLCRMRHEYGYHSGCYSPLLFTIKN